MNIKFPVLPPGQFGSMLQLSFETISRAFQSVISKNEATPRVLLMDADEQVWAVSITTTGTVTTTTISGKDREI